MSDEAPRKKALSLPPGAEIVEARGEVGVASLVDPVCPACWAPQSLHPSHLRVRIRCPFCGQVSMCVTILTDEGPLWSCWPRGG